MYINGSPTSVSYPAVFPGASGFTLAKGSAGGNSYWKGNIPSTQVYNRAISQFEVWQNFNALKGRYGIPDIVTNGLVLNLDAGNPYSYLSGSSGATWTNTVAVSSSISGTLVNGTTYTNGAMVFDGIDDYVNVPYNSSFNFSGNTSMTVCLWKKVNTQKAFPSIAAWGDQNGNNGGWQITDWKDSTFSGPYGTLSFARHQTGTSFITAVGYNYTSTSEALSTMYVCCVYDSILGSKLYINGSLVDSSITTGSISVASNFDLLLAKRQSEPTYLACNIYSTQVYNRALSAAEIQQNFNALRGRYGI